MTQELDYEAILEQAKTIAKEVEDLEQYVRKKESEQHVDTERFNFKWKLLNSILNKLFRRNSLLFTLAYTCLLISVFNMLEIQSPELIESFCTIFIFASLVFILLAIIATYEEVVYVLRRVGKLSNLFELYNSLGFLFGCVYAMIELKTPDSFNGLDELEFLNKNRINETFIVGIYISYLDLASIGFGDIAPKFIFGRFLLFIECNVSVVLLVILFGNIVE